MSPRHSTVRADSIEYGFWLVFSADGAMRFSRGEPSISRDERSMYCSATLPKSLFKTPTLRATIGINEAVQSEFKVDINAASEALRQTLGVDIDLKVIQP